MFNPIIVVAIIIQSLVSRVSRLTGAILGYVITTGILLWGISLYGEGAQIVFFGIPLSEGGFFVLCLAWYGLDTWTFAKARRLSKLARA